MFETSTEDFLVVGKTRSSNGDVHRNNGISDYWIIKLNADGDTLWTRSFGGSQFDQGVCALEKPNGNYLVVGDSQSDDYDLPGNYGISDIWILELDQSGNLLWSKNYGGTRSDYAYAVSMSFDSNYVVLGESFSDDYDLLESKGASDLWVFKINGAGNVLWSKTYGGSDIDQDNTIIKTTDSAYVIGG